MRGRSVLRGQLDQVLDEVEPVFHGSLLHGLVKQLLCLDLVLRKPVPVFVAPGQVEDGLRVVLLLRILEIQNRLPDILLILCFQVGLEQQLSEHVLGLRVSYLGGLLVVGLGLFHVLGDQLLSCELVKVPVLVHQAKVRECVQVLFLRRLLDLLDAQLDWVFIQLLVEHVPFLVDDPDFVHCLWALFLFRHRVVVVGFLEILRHELALHVDFPQAVHCVHVLLFGLLLVHPQRLVDVLGLVDAVEQLVRVSDVVRLVEVDVLIDLDLFFDLDLLFHDLYLVELVRQALVQDLLDAEAELLVVDLDRLGHLQGLEAQNVFPVVHDVQPKHQKLLLQVLLSRSFATTAGLIKYLNLRLELL